ncbi:MAG: hypothetical protein COT34_01600 [Candidatus Nealsonbacteria bacterium CG08_land_8_20_14_0_20_43_11]|uniref:Type II secretion system protein J n=1 Tax=Candidatus Nealsonbacteria bacterium CG08_land_8_20_14_0_20_43_11 TaxID=1974706 RepID=A0A2M6T149_9BACT|nr:MAG: hypothetical protein COT34_01600 [Candidatus Nealsonbacteria bacterium CG08_land_8_20_14_0_20_43_11]
MKIIFQKQKSRGFSLVELLVAVLVFSLMIVEISGIFVSGMKNQRYSLAAQQLLDQTSYSLEFMGRALRMARKETDAVSGDCLSANGKNYEVNVDNTSIRFINHLENDDCQRFYWDSSEKKLKFQRKILVPWPDEPETFDLTSKKIEVTKLKFLLDGELETDSFQPRVTVLMEMKWKEKAGEEALIKIQTTVSQRNLDITYY